jgi:hypothetical protein
MTTHLRTRLCDLLGSELLVGAGTGTLATAGLAAAGAGLIHDILPAAEIVSRLAVEAESAWAAPEVLMVGSRR